MGVRKFVLRRFMACNFRQEIFSKDLIKNTSKIKLEGFHVIDFTQESGLKMKLLLFLNNPKIV